LNKLNLYPNDYYNYLKNRKAAYYQKKEQLKQQIKELYHQHNGTLGYRMICDLLNRKNVACSYGTVYSYMREMGIKATTRRKKQPYKKGYIHHIFANLIGQDFTTQKPNQVWCTDFTYLKLKNGSKRYNCSIIDLYDRSIVASLNSKWIDTSLAINTLEIALSTNKINNNLILHSDQGAQFASRTFINFCAKNNIAQSMSRAGNPYDNAPMERFYNTMKAEFVYQYTFETDDDLNQGIYEYIFDWYNHRRPHTYKGGKTPFETRYSN
jgi:transposase InsO family protein